MGGVELNRTAWAGGRLAREYSAAEEALQPPEAAALRAIGPQIHGRPILDLGVGAGRTTSALLALGSGYVGVDFSPDMVSACRTRFPQADIRQLDARDLSVFEDNRFALVMFSFNGLDYVGHDGRLRILAEVHRVLAPAGWFLFSAHNRDAPPRVPWDLQLIAWTANPLRLARRIARWLAGIARHLAMRGRLEEHPTYAIWNDQGENFRFLTYYIRANDQRAQLAEAGFAVETVYGLDGRAVDPGAADASPWLYYLCRRSARDGSGGP